MNVKEQTFLHAISQFCGFKKKRDTFRLKIIRKDLNVFIYILAAKGTNH